MASPTGTSSVSLSQTIRGVVADRLGLDLDAIQPDSSIRGDLGADSMDIADMVLELETVTGIEIPDDDLWKLITVRDIIDYAWRKLDSRSN